MFSAQMCRTAWASTSAISGSPDNFVRAKMIALSSKRPHRCLAGSGVAGGVSSSLTVAKMAPWIYPFQLSLFIYFVINRFSATWANTYILLSPSPVSSTYHNYMYVCAHARGHLLFISLDSMEVKVLSRIGRAVAPSPIQLFQKTERKKTPEKRTAQRGVAVKVTIGLLN